MRRLPIHCREQIAGAVWCRRSATRGAAMTSSRVTRSVARNGIGGGMEVASTVGTPSAQPPCRASAASPTSSPGQPRQLEAVGRHQAEQTAQLVAHGRSRGFGEDRALPVVAAYRIAPGRSAAGLARRGARRLRALRRHARGMGRSPGDHRRGFSSRRSPRAWSRRADLHRRDRLAGKTRIAGVVRQHHGWHDDDLMPEPFSAPAR